MTEKILKPTGADDTALLQGAIDDCFLAGGGKVTLSDGVYNIKTIRLRSNITLYLKSGAYIKASRNIADYDTLRKIEERHDRNLHKSLMFNIPYVRCKTRKWENPKHGGAFEVLSPFEFKEVF